MIKLTKYQAAQLLYLYFNGDFSHAKRVSAKAWYLTIDTLLQQGLIDSHLNITTKGQEWLDDNYRKIDTNILKELKCQDLRE